MKKIIIFFLICLLGVTGCTNNHAGYAVTEYLNKFKNHEKEVISSLDELLVEENLLKEQNELYKLIMKKQYVDLEYKIKDITYNGNKAVVKVLLEVYDYQNSKIEAKKIYEKNKTDYLDENGQINKEKYYNLQLKKMKEEKRRVKYTVEFNVNLHDKNWVLETPNREVIEKIHGLYNYEEED